MQEIDRSDPYHLQRFVDAQATTFEQARNELQAGHKTGHWMWFMFPQMGPRQAVAARERGGSPRNARRSALDNSANRLDAESSCVHDVDLGEVANG
jgi:uncharacterized protein (DUF1810 family)